MKAAWALHPTQRAAFEQAVLSELQRLPPATRSAGTLHRVITAYQRPFLGAAIGAANISRYDRPSALRGKGK